jgi:hypothetical protein
LLTQTSFPKDFATLVANHSIQHLDPGSWIYPRKKKKKLYKILNVNVIIYLLINIIMAKQMYSFQEVREMFNTLKDIAPRDITIELFQLDGRI